MTCPTEGELPYDAFYLHCHLPRWVTGCQMILYRSGREGYTKENLVRYKVYVRVVIP